MGDRDFGINPETIQTISEDIKEVYKTGVQICLVIGAGNIFRGVSDAARGIERTSADYMGMLATVMNALAVQSVLEEMGIATRVQSAIPMATVCEAYIRRRAVRHMEKNRVVIFAGGTGNPFFTTDTAAALRAVEMNCDVLLKGTQVDGVYDSDPKKNKGAKRFQIISYQEVLTQNLRVLDTAAIALARENNLPILVFSIHDRGCLADIISGEGTYTIIN
jgi:uridylate kinase